MVTPTITLVHFLQHSLGMKWNQLTSVAQLDEIDKESRAQAVLIYKHSSRCGICTAAKGRIERNWPPGTATKPYFLDVLKNREVSDAVSTRYQVDHESPQALLIQDGACRISRSHMEIDPSELFI
jgi:bacillithiol system protein YtxJ